MSGGSDNIFDRWSRRKQAVRDSEKVLPDAEELAPEAIAPQADALPAEPDDRVPAAAEPDDREPAEPLPRLEDLTAQSDLSAFLREGVPKALRSAAMRKMWSLDPAIRDYIGPSEYAWDFNQPGSMAGFGPLDNAGESVAEFLSTMSGGARAGLARFATNDETSSPVSDPPVSGTPDSEAPAPTPEVSSKSPDAAPETETEAPASPAPLDGQEAAPTASAPSAETSPSLARPRHGGALPRCN